MLTFGILAAQEVGHLLAGRNQLRRVARLLGVEQAEAVHHHGVPRAAANLGQLVGKMKIKAAAAARLERHVVVEAGLLRERLEQRGDAADAFVIEIGHGVGAIEADGGARSEQKRIADEEHARCRRSRRSR